MAITCSRQSVLLALACLCVAPASAFAQSTLTGVVKDTSGAVLPGVTVEAASPVLIEKTRSAVTDRPAATASSISGQAFTRSPSR